MNLLLDYPCGPQKENLWHSFSFLYSFKLGYKYANTCLYKETCTRGYNCLNNKHENI